MTRGETLAIIQMLESCGKDISFNSVKRVARAIGIEVAKEEKADLEKIIQVRLDIKKEEPA